MAIHPFLAAKMACQARNWGMTNLELQKTLYICQMIYIGRSKGIPLIDDTFEAWDYGPVLPSVYDQVKMFGSNTIKDVFYGYNVNTNSENYKNIYEVCKAFADKNAGQLVNITHWEGGAWAKNYKKGIKRVKISNSDILEEYNKRQ